MPVAGTGTVGSTGDDGPAIAYVIRKITPEGIISRVAEGTAPITVDGGSLYFFLQDGTLQRLYSDGRMESVTGLPQASGVAVDSSGKMYVSAGGGCMPLTILVPPE